MFNVFRPVWKGQDGKEHGTAFVGFKSVKMKTVGVGQYSIPIEREAVALLRH